MSTIVPHPELPTVPATGAAVFSTGGGFRIMFTDVRQMATKDGRLENVHVEVARVRLTAQALLHLERTSAEARAIHEKIFGTLPSIAAIDKVYGDQSPANAELRPPPGA
jgi:hypothetical protein